MILDHLVWVKEALLKLGLSRVEQFGDFVLQDYRLMRRRPRKGLPVYSITRE